MKDKSCQTALQGLINSHVKFIYRQTIHDHELSECHSFFLENTLADDDTPVYVERSTIPDKETENPVQSDELQSAKFLLYTEDFVSETDKNDTYCQTLLATKLNYFDT